MKKTRIKIPLPTLATRDDAEAAMNDLALAANNQRQIIARRDQFILEVTERYAADLARCDQAIKEKTDALRAWAEANPTQFPKDRKSLKLAAGTLGFRTGTPKLALFSRSWTWEKVLERIKKVGFAALYIRSKEEVNKDALIADAAKNRDQDGAALALQNMGVKVTQDESFFIEPDLTPIETRMVP